MMERLELAIYRLARIPGEKLVPAPYLDYFEETAAFLLAALKNENTASLRAFLNADKYPSSFAAPSFAAARLGPEMGPLLSAVYAELVAIVPCRLEGDEAGMAALLELYLEIYGDFTGEDLPAPRAIRDIFRYYAEDYLPDHAAGRLRERVVPKRTRFTEIPGLEGASFRKRLEAADLSDPAYLYGLDPFAPESALALADRCRALEAASVEELAERFADECVDRILDDACRSWRVRTVGLYWPEGAERILLAVVGALETRGLAVTLPRAADRLTLKNDYMSRGFPVASPCPAFSLDHREDIALILDANYLTRRRRAAREAYEAVKQDAGAFGGVFELVLPDLAETGGSKELAGGGWGEGRAFMGFDLAGREKSPGPLTLTPAQVRLWEGLTGSLEDIRSRYEAY